MDHPVTRHSRKSTPKLLVAAIAGSLFVAAGAIAQKPGIPSHGKELEELRAKLTELHKEVETLKANASLAKANTGVMADVVKQHAQAIDQVAGRHVATSVQVAPDGKVSQAR